MSGDALALWAHLIDSPEVGVLAFMAGWVAGLVSGYTLQRAVLR